MPLDIPALLEEFERVIAGSPDVDALRVMRNTLDNRAFGSELIGYAQGINDPDTLDEFLARMRGLKRDCEDRAHDRDFQKDQAVQIGTVGGVGLVGGSIVAAASATFPPIALIPICGGAWMAFSGYLAGRRLNLESLVYRHLGERLGELLEKIDD